MDRDALYRGIVQELRGRRAANTPYALVKCSGLLRQMLTDGQPLVAVVNKTRRIQLVFRAAPDTLAMLAKVVGNKLAMQFQNPAGLFMPDSSLCDYTRDQFLALHCGQVGPDRVSVKDLIRFGAHVLGGIHSDPPKDAADHLLVEIDRAIVTGEMTLSLQAIGGIVDVTLRALEPLSRAVGGV